MEGVSSRETEAPRKILTEPEGGIVQGDPTIALFSCVCSLVIMGVFAFAGYNMGKSKSVGPIAGALIAAFGGLIGLIVLAVLPDKAMPRRRRRPISGRSGPSRRRSSGYGREEDADPPMVAQPVNPEPPRVSMRISCPNCDKKFTIDDPSRFGQKAKCASCGIVFQIPHPPSS